MGDVQIQACPKQEKVFVKKFNQDQMLLMQIRHDMVDMKEKFNKLEKEHRELIQSYDEYINDTCDYNYHVEKNKELHVLCEKLKDEVYEKDKLVVSTNISIEFLQREILKIQAITHECVILELKED